jgi:tetratricopeptide (TPR) repeat protein
MDRIERINEMLKQNPTDSFLLFALGLEKIKTGSENEALLLFEKIIDTNPDYSGVYYHLGKLLEQKSESEKAIDVYEKGMQVCKKLNEQHNYNELRGALDLLIY